MEPCTVKTRGQRLNSITGGAKASCIVHSQDCCTFISYKVLQITVLSNVFRYLKTTLVWVFLSFTGHLQQSFSGNALMISLCPAFPFQMVELAPVDDRQKFAFFYLKEIALQELFSLTIPRTCCVREGTSAPQDGKEEL